MNNFNPKERTDLKPRTGEDIPQASDNELKDFFNRLNRLMKRLDSSDSLNTKP